MLPTPLDKLIALVCIIPNAISFRRLRMAKKGLTHETLVRTAEEMITEGGYDSFSINELARRLEVKPASLYNHMKNAEGLSTEVGLRAIKSLSSAMVEAAKGKKADDALLSLAIAYRTFAHENAYLYHVIMLLPMTDNEVLLQVTPEFVEPILNVLAEYGLSEEQRLHWQRILRSVMHGFVSQENAGFFSHYPIDSDKSYRMAITAVIDSIHMVQRDVEAK